jgi:lactoylglutathione lyase
MMIAMLLMLATPAQAAVVPTATARFDHLALHVADVDRSAEFYRRMFGLSELKPSVAGPRWLSLGGSAALHLIGGRTVPVADNRVVHLALAVSDFDAMIARLKADGIEFTDFLGKVGAINRVRGDGARQIFLRDPDGYWIEVNDIAKP